MQPVLFRLFAYSRLEESPCQPALFRVVPKDSEDESNLQLLEAEEARLLQSVPWSAIIILDKMERKCSFVCVCAAFF